MSKYKGTDCFEYSPCVFLLKKANYSIAFSSSDSHILQIDLNNFLAYPITSLSQEKIKILLSRSLTLFLYHCLKMLHALGVRGYLYSS